MTECSYILFINSHMWWALMPTIYLLNCYSNMYTFFLNITNEFIQWSNVVSKCWHFFSLIKKIKLISGKLEYEQKLNCKSKELLKYVYTWHTLQKKSSISYVCLNPSSQILLRTNHTNKTNWNGCACNAQYMWGRYLTH